MPFGVSVHSLTIKIDLTLLVEALFMTEKGFIPDPVLMTLPKPIEEPAAFFFALVHLNLKSLSRFISTPIPRKTCMTSTKTSCGDLVESAD